MVLDKRQQAVLYDRCREALGDEGADLLMQELPPTGWDDIATKQDLALLKQDLEHSIDVLEQKLEMLEHKLIGAIERGLRDQSKLYIVWTGGLTATMVAAFTGLAALVAR